VTVTLGLDGSGKVDIVAGGYDDWEKRRSSPAKAGVQSKKNQPPLAAPGPRPSPGNKLSYKDQRDLDRLPSEIERIETEIAKAEQALHDPDLYSRDPRRFHSVTEQVSKLRSEKSAAEERWLEVAALAEALSS
jgi:ATP-binding cassette subfamily F protein uup